MRILIALLLLPCLLHAQELRFEKSNGLETATYQEVVRFYQSLAETSEKVTIMEMGQTDSGNPLHLVMYSADGNVDMAERKSSNRRLLFVNNGIHPGEPCGVDASMMFFRDLLKDDALAASVGSTIIASIPLYNIGGALNRGPYSRVNQQGPSEHGFRGNARNFDLNRDFVKQDTRNARSFAEIFQLLDPDVFLDTHTSDGADYQHVMTLVEGQADKLGGALGLYYRNEFLPAIYSGMRTNGYPMVPYVQTMKRTPDDGIAGFYDSPRYSSGYAALYQTMAMISEAHMLKTYKERVEGTRALIEVVAIALETNAAEIGKIRAESKEWVMNKKQFPLHWVLDESRSDEIEFMGYEAGSRSSEITGQMRLFYDRGRPWTKKILHYSYYKPTIEVAKPSAYVIPQSQHEVIANLERNGVELSPIQQDTTMQVVAYSLDGYQTRQRPYEGHYMHHSVQVGLKDLTMDFRAGDMIAYTNQEANRYLIETLEPMGYDSFFAWNYFDTYIQMKEYFDPYVFEDIAAAFLREHPEVKDELEKKKMTDEKFRSSGWAQLLFIYQQTPYFEPSYNRYPIYRIK